MISKILEESIRDKKCYIFSLNKFSNEIIEKMEEESFSIKDKLIYNCEFVISRIEKMSDYIKEYEDLSDERIYGKDISYYDDYDNYCGVYLEVEFSDGYIRMSKTYGNFVTNTYYGNYLDEYTCEDLFIILENLMDLFNNLMEWLVELYEEEEEYERRLNKILHKENYKDLIKLSKEYYIDI